MRYCIGERRQGEGAQIRAAFPDWHGKYGHLNVLELDHESECTGFGKHDRVVAFCPQNGELYARSDSVWDIQAPSPYQVLRACVLQNGREQMGRIDSWEFIRTEQHESGKSTGWYFRKKKGRE